MLTIDLNNLGIIFLIVASISCSVWFLDDMILATCQQKNSFFSKVLLIISLLIMFICLIIYFK